MESKISHDYHNLFQQIIGQQSAIETFKRALNAASIGVIDSQEMSATWLIVGPPGSGRTNIAHEFAKGLLCNEGGCLTCSACTSVDALTHPDLEFFRREGLSIKVDEVRELIERASWQPAAAKFRVTIIEDADRLTESAANALLKAIEEPGARTVWILCAPSTVDVLPTIRSRARVVGLQTPNTNDISALLIKEGIEPKSAEFAALISLGHVGKARALANNKSLRDFRANFLQKATTISSIADAYLTAGWLNDSVKEEVEKELKEQNENELEKLRQAWGENGKKLITGGAKAVKELEANQKARNTRMIRSLLDQSLIDLITFYRDVFLWQNSQEREDLTINKNLTTLLQSKATEIPPYKTLAIIDAITQTREDISRSAAPLLALESLMVKLFF